MKYVVTFGEREVEIQVDQGDDGQFDLVVDGRPARADFRPAGGESLFSLLLDNCSFEVSVVRKEEVSQVTLRGRSLDMRVESEQERNARLVGGTGKTHRRYAVKSPMPGFVSRLLIREGEEVQTGTPLLILEAMKMENEIRAVAPGTVARVLVKEQQPVNGGDELVLVD